MGVKIEEISSTRLVSAGIEGFDLNILFEFPQDLGGLVAHAVQAFRGHIEALLMFCTQIIDENEHTHEQQNGHSRIDSELGGATPHTGTNLTRLQNQGNDNENGS